MSLRGVASTVEPFEVYQKYLALRNHFSQEGYDYFKYNGKVRAQKTSFDVRKDKHFFYRLSKMKDPVNYMLANFVDGDKEFFSGSLRDDTAKQIHQEFENRRQRLFYQFKEDLEHFKDDFDENIIVPEFEHPYALRLYLRKDICIEVLIILNKLCIMFKYWDEKLDDPIWPDIKFKCKKYEPFISVDLDKYKGYIMERFGNESGG